MNVEGLRSLPKARGKLERLGAVNSSVFRFLHTFTFKLIAINILPSLSNFKKVFSHAFQHNFFVISLLCDCVRLSLLLFGDCTSIPKVKLFPSFFFFLFAQLGTLHCQKHFLYQLPG